VQDTKRGRLRQKYSTDSPSPSPPRLGNPNEEVIELERGYLELERHAHLETSSANNKNNEETINTIENDEETDEQARKSLKERDRKAGRVVDIVLSDMSAPWDQTTGFSQRSVTEPYRRMMNTSGNSFRDHIGSLVRFFCFPILPSQWSWAFGINCAS
jgi:21S rRNA (uridine2791-2'-O)-methyltransferase